MSRRFAFATCAFLLLLVIACSGREGKNDAETAGVPTFHARYDRSDFDTIYNDAAEDFRSASPTPDYDKFMAAVRRKLGRVKSTELKTWNVHVTARR